VENLRLLAQAEHYRAKAEEAVRRLTQRGWAEYFENISAQEVGFEYDQNAVNPWTWSEASPPTDQMIRMPLHVGNESIGELAVIGMDASGDEGPELLATVAGQLSAHLENLRLLSSAQKEVEERRKAEDKIEKRAAELETVAKLSAAVTALSEPALIMQTVVDMVKETFGLYHAHIYELDQTKSALVLSAGAGQIGQRMVADGWEIPLDHAHSLVARAARERQGIITNDIRKEPDFLPNPLLTETRAEMAIPILLADKVLGVLDIQSEHVDHFSQEDVHIQATLAAQVAVALENGRLYQKTQSALAETKTMYTISSAATRSLELDQILQETLEQILAATGFTVGLISMVDEATEKLQLAAQHNLPEALAAKLGAMGLDGTLCDLVYRRRQPLAIGDLRQGAPSDVSGLVKLGLHSYQGVPVEAKGRVLGTICVFAFQPKNIQPSEMTLMQAAAQQIGIAIENVRLFRQVQRQAAYEAAVNSISQKIQSTTTVENAMQVAIRELGRALGAERTSIQLNASRDQRGTDATRNNGKK
jgi:GAF domain-containing protein